MWSVNKRCFLFFWQIFRFDWKVTNSACMCACYMYIEEQSAKLYNPRQQIQSWVSPDKSKCRTRCHEDVIIISRLVIPAMIPISISCRQKELSKVQIQLSGSRKRNKLQSKLMCQDHVQSPEKINVSKPGQQPSNTSID
jgi:hypothetical protein